MKRSLSISFLCLLPLILANFSSQQSETGKKGHAINIYGKVTTRDPLTTINIEDISISGEYENISVYPKPAEKDTDPTKNRSTLNLLDDRTIVPQVNAGKSPIAYTFKNREYIEITVLRKNKKKENYLIERDKQLFCHETTDSKPKRMIVLEAIKKLDISGFHCGEENREQVSKQDKERVRELLGELSTDIKTVNQPTREKLEKTVQELTTVLESLS